MVSAMILNILRFNASRALTLKVRSKWGGSQVEYVAVDCRLSTLWEVECWREGDISKEVDERPVEIDIVIFKSILIQALDSLHGKVGSAIGVDIIKFEASSMEAILRVKESGLVKLWSALTLLSYYKDRRCAIYVIQVSPYLLSLAADSRQWKIKEKEVTT
ncbi:hypothetical protein pdam_00021851 [Pocillopora damicornis]|uniref:Ribonucleases P/MRP subunit Pop8-like domain-containing protein n=1 Tax=Pocillopora damicornis TaxID=46731 RepID=A0A3M6THG7_POCDA|nr:hypothetical protein pdam_00021851 [Pocillopora damicornis]